MPFLSRFFFLFSLFFFFFYFSLWRPRHRDDADDERRENNPPSDIPPELGALPLGSAARAAAASSTTASTSTLTSASASAPPDLRRVDLLLQLVVERRGPGRHLQRPAVHLVVRVLFCGALEACDGAREQRPRVGAVRRQEALRRVRVAEAPQSVVLLRVDRQRLVELVDGGGDFFEGLGAGAEVGELEQGAAPLGEGLRFFFFFSKRSSLSSS